MRLRPYGEPDRLLTEQLETDPVVKRHLGGVLTRAEAGAVHQQRMAAVERGDRFWVVMDAVTDMPIGVTGVWSTVWDDDVVDEVGWMLLSASHGQGYGRRSADATVQQARREGRVAVIHAFPATVNTASNAICRSLRFRRLDDADLEYAGRPLRCSHWALDLSG